MDLFTAMKIGGSGLAVQRARMNVISSNLANVNTTRTAEGGPYKKKSLVVEAVGVTDSTFSKALGAKLKGVHVAEIKEDQSPPRLKYNPSHPDANEDGYVAMPNVNVVEEMVDMVNASRAYEANAATINAVKSMAQRAIDMGSR